MKLKPPRELPPDIVVLEITGRITIGRECKQLEWAADSLVRVRQQKKIIFDLSEVTHIDSTGVGILVTSAGQVKKRAADSGWRAPTNTLNTS